MTSTVTAATMTVTLTETITLNGVDYGGTNTLSIASINEASKRIVTATNAESIILKFGDAVSAGKFDEDKVMYIRLTNLDDTNSVGLIFRNEDDNEFSVRLDKGQSFIYNGNLALGVVDTMDAAAVAVTPNTFADLEEIAVEVPGSSGETVDIEFFVACI